MVWTPRDAYRRSSRVYSPVWRAISGSQTIHGGMPRASKLCTADCQFSNPFLDISSRFSFSSGSRRASSCVITLFAYETCEKCRISSHVAYTRFYTCRFNFELRILLSAEGTKSSVSFREERKKVLIVAFITVVQQRRHLKPNKEHIIAHFHGVYLNAVNASFTFTVHNILNATGRLSQI